MSYAHPPLNGGWRPPEVRPDSRTEERRRKQWFLLLEGYI